MKGHVRKRGSKWCFVLDIGPNPETGKRRQKWFSGFSTKKEAEREMAKKIHELNTGAYVEPSKMTLEEFLKCWLQDYAKINCAPRTYDGYAYMINNHIIPSIGGITLDKLRPIHIQKYYSQKLVTGRMDGNGGLSARSVHHHHRVLSEALEYAVNMQVLANNPAKSVAPPKPQKKQMNVLTKEQIEILLEGAKKSSSRLYEAIYIAINTGMRRGEIGGLRWKDIDFKNNLISIRQTLIRTKELGLQLREAAKTDGSRRSIAISDSLIHLLKKMKAKQAQ